MEAIAQRGEFVSFSSKLQTFVGNLGIDDIRIKKEITTEIVRYYLGVCGSRKKHTFVLKSMFSKLSLRNEIDTFQREYLHISYYLHRVLYPAIVRLLHTSEKETGLLAEDIHFCMSYLKEKEIAVLRENTLNYDISEYAGFTIGQGWIPDYKSLQKYVFSKVKKFQVLFKNDPSMDVDDFTQEIVFAIIRVYNVNPQAFANKSYVDMAVNNQINTFLSYFTRGKRKRLNNSSDADYNKMKALKGKLSRLEGDDRKDCEANLAELKKTIQTTESSYTSVLVDYSSLGGSSAGDNVGDNVIDFNEIRQAYSYYNEDIANDMVYVSEILKKSESKKMMKEYFQIILDSNPDFEAWLESNNYATNNFSSLCKNAKKYLKSKYNSAPSPSWAKHIGIFSKSCLTI
jgi:hypothetical protein